MLHATAGKKSTLYRRYLPDRDRGTERVSAEDEITSAIIGPQDFLLAPDVFRFWKRVFETSKSCVQLPSDCPEKVKVSLWPRRGQIEPDATIVFEWATGEQFTLLIELKWRAGLSGNDQLHRQWLEYLDSSTRDHALHVFIAPEIGAALSARSSNDVWKGRLVLLSWLQIRSILSELSIDDSALGRWAKLADSFLSRVGIQRFGGFLNLITTDKLSNTQFTPPLFFVQN